MNTPSDSRRGLLVVCALFGILLPASGGNAEEEPYAVAKIPPSLRTGSQAVMRVNEHRFEVKDRARARYTVKRAVTIFSKEKRDWGELYLGYDRFSSIEELEGAIYDANGEQIRTLSSGDIKDVSAVSSVSLYDDNRVRIAALYSDVYPYTVEYRYEIVFRGSLNWPVWYAQATVDAVELSTFEVTAPTDAGVRHWCNRRDVTPQTENDGSDVTYRWQAGSLPSISPDAVGFLEDVTTIVRIAPTDFVLENRPGSMGSWTSFGKWLYDLHAETDRLPDKAVAEVRTLLKPTATLQEKVQTLYRYLQSRVRYVSIQLGIGGWKPFSAAFVHERGYGDCKALSNYMIALLHAGGIKAYPVAIYMGHKPLPMVKEFPSNQFNHEIVCVPLPGDTIWLECTSRTMPFGHLDDETEDRDALLLTAEGGVVVRTPTSIASQNLQRRTGTISLIWTGGIQADITTTTFGNEQDNTRLAVAEATAEERQQWAVAGIPVANPSLTRLEISGIDVPSDSAAVRLGFSAPRLATGSGNRLFFIPNLMERTVTAPSPSVVRLSPVRISYPFRRTDSLLYRLPAGFTTEALPAVVTLSPSFATYEASAVALGDTAVAYTRVLEFRDRVIPLEQYNEYRAFLSDIVKADRAQAVLVRK